LLIQNSAAAIIAFLLNALQIAVSLADASQYDMRAVTILRQARVLAELLAPLQAPRRGSSSLRSWKISLMPTHMSAVPARELGPALPLAATLHRLLEARCHSVYDVIQHCSSLWLR
jgi:hypothetical protein